MDMSSIRGRDRLSRLNYSGLLPSRMQVYHMSQLDLESNYQVYTTYH